VRNSFIDRGRPSEADITVSRGHRQAGHVGLRVEARTVDIELPLLDAKADPVGAAVDDLCADNRTIEVDVRCHSDTAITMWSRRMTGTWHVGQDATRGMRPFNVL
jgi:hypothetical protein